MSPREEQVRQLSRSSSRSPGSAGSGKATRPQRKPGKGRRDGQLGHPGQSQDFSPI
ncbi:MAG: hypothetical protein AAF892_05270 [Cyanobacteria bacterium P01_D01_bin.71]